MLRLVNISLCLYFQNSLLLHQVENRTKVEILTHIIGLIVIILSVMALIFSTDTTNDQSIAFNYLMTVINGVQTEWSIKGGLCASSTE